MSDHNTQQEDFQSLIENGYAFKLGIYLSLFTIPLAACMMYAAYSDILGRKTSPMEDLNNEK